MAERRMFAKSVIGSARFLRMPSTSRLLYYDLGMQADDDGVVEAFSVMRTTGATEDDLRVLASKGFVSVLNDDLVAYITDWKINNQIRKDRYSPSIYSELLVKLCGDNQTATVGLPNGNQLETQVSIGKDSIDNTMADKPPGRVISKPKYQPEWFDRFWALYPRRTNRGQAVKAWDKLKPDMELCKIMADAIRVQMRSEQWQDPRHIPHPSTWLNGERWNDEIFGGKSPDDPPPRKTGRLTVDENGEEVVLFD